MADGSTDIASKEELSICARWLESGKAVEHFLGIVNIPEVHAEAIKHYLLQVLSGTGISPSKLRGLGFDGDVRKEEWSASWYASSCSKCSVYSMLLLQTTVSICSEYNEVKRVLGTLLSSYIENFPFLPQKG